MKPRKVQMLLYAEQYDMGGIPVRQPIPTHGVKQVDPFILLHHHQSHLETGSNEKTSGVGPHPHRGFSPVSFVLKGDVHHRDSRGNSSIVKAGGVQWMNAARGLIHSERPSAQLAEEGGEQEIIQLWVNLPSKHKMDQPEYIALHKDDIPVYQGDDGLSELQMIAGNVYGITGPVQSKSPLLISLAQMKAGACLSIPVPETYNLCVYIIEGQLKIQGYGLTEALHLAIFGQEGDGIQIQAKSHVKALILAGQPINEPMEQQGPFVMNNTTQILEAIRDYQMGKMGVLIEEF